MPRAGPTDGMVSGVLSKPRTGVTITIWLDGHNTWVRIPAYKLRHTDPCFFGVTYGDRSQVAGHGQRGRWFPGRQDMNGLIYLELSDSGESLNSVKIHSWQPADMYMISFTSKVCACVSIAEGGFCASPCFSRP